jgi:hypothetical protein
MKLNALTKYGRAAAICGLAAVLAGCSADIAASLRFDDRMLVKIPVTGKKPPEDATVAADGWNFRHLVEAPHDRENAGDWYVTWQDSDLARHRPEWRILLGRWERTRRAAPALSDAARDALGAYPVMIEPNLVFARMVTSKEGAASNHPDPGAGSRPDGNDLEAAASRSDEWPAPADANPAWHLGDGYSQLAAAQSRVDSEQMRAIRIGILDNGFARRQAGRPAYLDEDSHGDAMGWTQGTIEDGLVKPGDWGGSHGTGTIGLLAGRKVRIFDQAKNGQPGTLLFNGALGGAPGATIVPVRVAPWVFSIETASLAYGIDYASRVKHCDVLSISHGGSPSQAWVDAVNAAYERGTAMFAAEGDFFTLGFDPLPPAPIFVPSAPVYPAAFRRVIGVTGVTAAGGSYARNSLRALAAHPLGLSSWMSRGSYGPDGVRHLFGAEALPDAAEKKYLGVLRAYPIAAFSPNVPWLVAPKDAGARADQVDLNGSGTSASTPQVAAAAALWLAYHRHDPGLEENWHNWRKTEAVYFALLASAQRPSRAGPDPYLGAGTLKANAALDLDYRQVSAMRGPMLNFPSGQMGRRDWFDGSRSFWALLWGQFGNGPRWSDRAKLKQDNGVIADRNKALGRLYYNTLLLEAWHKGELPDMRHDSSRIWREGKRLADHATTKAEEKSMFALR